MKAKGTCDDCDTALGVKVGGSMAALVGDHVERLMDQEGNGLWCPECETWTDPGNLSVED